MASGKIAALERQLHVASVGRLTGEEHRQAFIALAREGRDEVTGEQTERAGGIPPSVETVVDGLAGAPLESVKPGGIIRFDFKYLREIARFALDWLRENSPVESGAYKNAHFVMAGGAEIDPLEIPAEAHEIVVTNDKPYARKIQVGMKSLSVPPGIYDRARIAVARRYGNIVSVDLKFIELAGGYVLKGGRGKGRRRRGRADGEPLTYPALIITAR
jgi:hypothetical protein